MFGRSLGLSSSARWGFGRNILRVMLCIRYRLNMYAANIEPFLLIIHMKHPVMMLVNHPKPPTKTGV